MRVKAQFLRRKGGLSDQRYITELLEDLCENSHSGVSKYVMSESAEEQRRFAVSGGWEGDSLTSWPMRFTRNPSPYLTCLVSLRVWCNIFSCFALSPGRASLKSARVCYTAKSSRRKYGASKHNSLMKLFCKERAFSTIRLSPLHSPRTETPNNLTFECVSL